MKVHELVAACAKAVKSSDPMSSTREVLEHLRANVEAIEHALGYISGIGGNARQVFYRSPHLTMLKVCFPEGRRTPPHDHGTWAAILLLSPGNARRTCTRLAIVRTFRTRCIERAKRTASLKHPA
jgi:predicted metal-dependent enzyme (double-stranded beta helix superfamily)